MKKITLAVFFLLYTFGINAQNCANTSVGYPPVNDLGTGYWRGFQGGLYPNGSNYRPVAHNAAGLNIASQIMPLDTAGNVDKANGKIVWLSIGMSNTTMESQAFIPLANSFSQKNPKLILVDGAQGGQDIVIIDDPNANFWNVVKQRLASAGLTSKQVQIVWFKEAEKMPADTAFSTYPNSLKVKYKTAIQILKKKFTNTKLCYLSSRIYAGYATSALNPEPYAYYSGWSVKRLIENQVNGDTTLAFSGSTPRAPWLAWGPYFWADGTTPRSDGLTWNCPSDYNSDGTHPSTTGRQKVAKMLLDFFSTDATTVPWFLKACYSITITAAGPTIFCSGGSVVLNSSITGSPTSLQWKRNGSPIPGATSASYTATTSGNYTLTVSGTCGHPVTSNSISVTANPKPNALVTPAGNTGFCPPATVTLTCNTAPGWNFKWFKDDVSIPGANHNTYTASTTGGYSCKVAITTTGCYKKSNIATLVNNCKTLYSANNEVSITPNPSAGEFRIDLGTMKTENLTLNIYDEQGRLITSKKLSNNISFFGNDFKPGIYFAEILDNNIQINRIKIVKSK